MWTTSNWQARQKTQNRLGTFSWKTLTWENQHHFFTMYFWVALKESQISKDIVANCRDMFESRISAGAKEKLPTRASGKPDAETISSWSCNVEGHAKNVERYCELANKTTPQLYKIATPCMDDHQFKVEKISQLENCPKYAHKLS